MRMLKSLLRGTALALCLFGSAQAVCPVPYCFTNGNTADAGQVNSDFASVAPLANPSFTGNVGIGTASPAFKLEVTTAGAGTDGFSVDSGANIGLNLRPNNSSGASNPLVVAGDKSIIYSAGSAETGNLVIAPWSNNSYGIRMTNTGNVGIGTSTPQAMLDVRGAVYFSTNYSGTFPNFGSAVGTNGGTIIGWNGGSGTIGESDFINFPGGGFGGFSFVLANGSGVVTSTPVVIKGNGNLGIGNTSPSYLLHVGSASASGIVSELQNSSGACTHTPGASSEVVSCSSDMRLKSNIQDTGSVLASLDDMRIRDFTVKATGERKTGVVAQEMIVHHPEMVHKNTAGFYSVDEPNPWLLVKTIQELHGMVSQQQAEIEQLRADLAAVKSGK